MKKVSRKNFESGLSITSVLVGIGLMGILAMIGAGQFKNLMNGQSRVDQRGDLNAFKRQVVDSANCSQTLATYGNPATCGYIDLRASDSLASVPRYVIKIDPLATGAFVGSGPVGNGWYARASCGTNSLVIEAARRAGTTWTFAKDPLSGVDLDFSAKPNPLFGNASTQLKLCSEYFGAQPKIKRLTAPATLVENTLPTTTCGGLDMQQGNNNPRFWSGVVDCGAGYTAMSGGDSRTSLFTSSGYSVGGWTAQDSYQDPANPQYWDVALCVYTNMALANGTVINGAVYAVCLKNN